MIWVLLLPFAITLPAVIANFAIIPIAHNRRLKQAGRPPLSQDEADRVYRRVFAAEVTEYEVTTSRWRVGYGVVGIGVFAATYGMPFLADAMVAILAEAEGRTVEHVEMPNALKVGLVVLAPPLYMIYGPVVCKVIAQWRAGALTAKEYASAKARATRALVDPDVRGHKAKRQLS